MTPMSRVPPIGSRRRPHADRLRAGLAAVGLVIVTIALVGCLPTGSRGSGVPGSDAVLVPTASPTAPPPTGPTPTPSFVPPTPTPAPTFLVVTVKSGDSLNTIAHAFGTTARSIAFWNRSTYPSLDPESPKYRPAVLQIGWTLFLVPNAVYDEDSGEAVDPSGALPEP